MEGIVRGIIKLNPLTEIIFLISVSIISFANNSLKLDVFILLMVAIIASFMGLVKISLKALSMFALLQGLKYFVLPILPDVISAHFGLLVIHAPKLIPIFLVGQILVKTNPIRNIMYALKMMHFPKSLIISLAIAIRYFPSLREEKILISDAIKIRGVTGFKKIQLGLISLIVTASNTADELAQAITVRGIENPARKTFMDDAGFNIWDLIIILLCILMFFNVKFKLFL
ncbi:TPA: energy-coupling factor transporter transmembrane protein EcfT [Streptococcus agalactiae]|uniref:energy-coupling factor transporter transmembrane component T family protein n=1 Tax=Streptococcus agalactiae TaxID=1311 RepID=UPI0002BB02F9|nr:MULTISPECIES: energy-coupling factor transporter transmembrane component T [Bacillota]HEN2517110.1 energy-coupling factor transporter transmembrane protein EcfT [Streptococcus agalactiae]HEP5157203.1 energy-coupling factor transporter transmembrane protein EcfT [Streptococcus pyogenes]EPT88424.1 cobalt transporter [Streptococcus agalactiae BSU247]HEN2518033.1 energy-coupling factor transporter transmembrane protein EcfT [Streptococcus agalactiae]HEN2519399.1 energy-coupling factor transport